MDICYPFYPEKKYIPFAYMLMSKIWPGHQVIGILLGFFTERRACSQKRLGVASTSLNMGTQM